MANIINVAEDLLCENGLKTAQENESERASERAKKKRKEKNPRLFTDCTQHKKAAKNGGGHKKMRPEETKKVRGKDPDECVSIVCFDVTNGLVVFENIDFHV